MFNVDDRVRVTKDVLLKGAMTGVVKSGTCGAIRNAAHARLGMYSVRLDDGHLVLFHVDQLELECVKPFDLYELERLLIEAGLKLQSGDKAVCDLALRTALLKVQAELAQRSVK